MTSDDAGNNRKQPAPLRLMGNFQVTVDERSRFVLPAEFLPALRRLGSAQLELVATISLQDNAAAFYPQAAFDAKLLELESEKTRQSASALQRVLNCSEQVKPDKQLRILIPRVLVELSRLRGEILAIGMWDHFILKPAAKTKDQV